MKPLIYAQHDEWEHSHAVRGLAAPPGFSTLHRFLFKVLTLAEGEKWITKKHTLL